MGNRAGTAAALAAGIALAGCAAAPTPQTSIQSLSEADPKFSSAECVDIRGKAVFYDDKVGQRAVVGMASGLLLGVFGLPIAAAADAAQNEEREAFNREIERRCMTNPPKRPPPVVAVVATE